MQLRFPEGLDNRLVLSFGVNDTNARAGRTRTEPEMSRANLDAILTGAEHAGWPALVVGPAPIADHDQTERIHMLNDQVAAVCSQHAVSYVDAFTRADISPPRWRRRSAARPFAGGGHS